MTTLRVVILPETLSAKDGSASVCFCAVLLEHFLVGQGSTPHEARVSLDVVIRSTMVANERNGYDGLTGIKPAPADLQAAYEKAQKLPSQTLKIGIDTVQVSEARLQQRAAA
jgi:hypothetical protein